MGLYFPWPLLRRKEKKSNLKTTYHYVESAQYKSKLARLNCKPDAGEDWGRGPVRQNGLDQGLGDDNDHKELVTCLACPHYKTDTKPAHAAAAAAAGLLCNTQRQHVQHSHEPVCNATR
jgi:hypothetical protein